MANPASPSPPGSTRQLLDELDALMQRMLALPVEQEEEAPPAPERTAPTAAVAPPVLPEALPPPVEPPAARTVALALSVPSAAPVDKPPPVAPAPAPRQDQPELPAGPHGLTPVGPEVFAALTTPTPIRPRTTPARPRPTPRRAAPVGGIVLGPLRWLNHAFDRVTHRLGAPGRWLRGRQGRAVLGWVGVALLVGALGWQMVVWLGWGW
jgi:hypothetical protein